MDGAAGDARADRGWDGGATGGSGAELAVAAVVMGLLLRVRQDQLVSVGYGAVVTLAAFGLVVVAATVGNGLGGAAGRETALVAVAVIALGLALLFGSYELRRRAGGGAGGSGWTRGGARAGAASGVAGAADAVGSLVACGLLTPSFVFRSLGFSARGCPSHPITSARDGPWYSARNGGGCGIDPCLGDGPVASGRVRVARWDTASARRCAGGVASPRGMEGAEQPGGLEGAEQPGGLEGAEQPGGLEGVEQPRGQERKDLRVAWPRTVWRARR